MNNTNLPIALKNMDQILKHLPAGIQITAPVFQHFSESQETAIFLSDANGYIICSNHAAQTLWGVAPVKGKSRWCGALKIYNTDGISIIPHHESPLAYAYKRKKSSDAEEIIIERPNGERSFVTTYSRLLFDKNNEINGAIVLQFDTNKGIQGEQKDEHLSAIVQSSDDAIVSKTLNGVITSWNAGAERIFGYKANEMIGQPLLKIIPKHLWNEEISIQERLRKGIRIDHFETKRVTKNNVLIDVSLTISPVMDASGTIIGASKIARDITKQKQNEAALLESEERHRLAIETARIGTWSYNFLSNELNCSSEGRKMLGFDELEDLNSHSFTNIVHTDDLQSVIEQFTLDKKYPGNDTYDLEYRILHPQTQNIKWIRIRGKLYFSTEGTPQKLIGTLMDITDEKTAKEKLEKTVRERTLELQQMNEQLVKSNQDLEQFAYIASHDLQEPLRKIQTFIQIVERESFKKEIVKMYFEKIKTSAERMSELIRGVLNYARLDKNEAQFTHVDLNQILEEVKLDYETLISAKHAEIKTSKLPVIKGLPTQLRQLFANLLSNALKFCSESPLITITGNVLSANDTTKWPQLEKGLQYAELNFTDNGIGFEQQYAEKIFLIFQRLHNKLEYNGTGIGLALCKKIVENHHGIITAKSENGQGATFTILLPVY